MNLIGKAMIMCFPIRLYYDRTPSRNIRTSTCERVLFDEPHQAVSVDSSATSGCIPESLDEAVRLAKEIGDLNLKVSLPVEICTSLPDEKCTSVPVELCTSLRC